MRKFVTAVAAALLGCSSLAAAQEADPDAPRAAELNQSPPADCLCVLRDIAGPQIGAVEDVRGQVLLAAGVGYTPVRSTISISIGDRIVLLEDGRAVLVAGPDCRVSLAPESVISIVPTEGGVCVAHASTVPGTPPGAVAVPVPGTPPGAVAVGATFAAGVAATAFRAISAAVDDDDPVSP